MSILIWMRAEMRLNTILDLMRLNRFSILVIRKESSDSSLVGIYRGNSYTEYEESIYDNSTVLIKDPYADVKINTRTDVEPSEFEYLGENELIIISGKNLYHGKLLS